METDRDRLIEELFHEVASLPEALRASFLAERCPDSALRQRVESLLRHDELAKSGFLACGTASPLKLEDPHDPILRDILDRAAEVPAEQRAAFLDSACGGDAALRAQAESLLAALAAGTPGVRADSTSSTSGSLVRALAQAVSKRMRLASDELVGTHVGRYKVLQWLGEGGMGVVYLAEQEQPLRRQVALKIIKPGMDSAAVIARFNAERQTLAVMDHPNIARVYDAGTTETGRPYFVMELVRGVPVTRYCDEKQLTVRQRLDLFVTICHAIQHAHQKGIIHRDIKASNVLAYASDGSTVVKVIDFGIAKALAAERPAEERALQTVIGQVFGTYAYMSPEQAEGNRDIDTRTDVYSLGVLLYELLAGALPFEDSTFANAADGEIRRIIREVEPPRPSTKLSTLGEALSKVAGQRRTDPRTLARTVRGELDWIVLRAMEKDRTRRYETANGLGADVQRYLDGQLIVAAPPSTAYRLRKFARRNKGPLSAMAAIIAVLIAGVAVSTTQWLHARRAESIVAGQLVEKAKLAEDLKRAFGRADKGRHDAEEAAKAAQRSQADTLAALAEVYIAKGQWEQALETVPRARAAALAVGESTAAADFQLADVYGNAPPPVAEFPVVLFSPEPGGLPRGHEINRPAVRPRVPLALRTDGHTVVGVSFDAVRFIDLHTGAAEDRVDLKRYRAPPYVHSDVAVSSDGKLAAVIVGKERNTFDDLFAYCLEPPKQIGSWVWPAESRGAMILSDVNSVLAESDRGIIEELDLSSGAAKSFATGPSGDLLASPSGRFVGNDNSIWSRSTHAFLYRNLEVLGITDSAFIWRGLDGSVKVTDLSSGWAIGNWKVPHAGRIERAAITGSGRYLVSLGADHAGSVVDTWTKDRVRRMIIGEDFRAMAVSTDPHSLVCVSTKSGAVKLWSAQEDGGRRAVFGQTQGVSLTRDGRLALQLRPRMVTVLDVATGKTVTRLPNSGFVSTAKISPDGAVVLLAGWRFGAIYATSGEHRLNFSVGPSTELVAFDEAGSRVAIVSPMSQETSAKPTPADGGAAGSTCAIVDLSDGHEVQRYDIPELFIGSNPKDDRLLCAGPRSLRVIETFTGRAIRSFEFNTMGSYGKRANDRPVCDPEVRLVALPHSGLIDVVDLAAGRWLETLDSRGNDFIDCEFSKDGRFLFSARANGTISVWDLTRHQEAHAFAAAGVMRITGVSDGPVLAVDMADGISFWDMDWPQKYAALEPRANKARLALQRNPKDADALSTLGEWYALRGLNSWAVEHLERARANGVEPSALMLARCYWLNGDFEKAAREFDRALHSEPPEAPVYYLKLCLQATAREASEDRAAAGVTQYWWRMPEGPYVWEKIDAQKWKETDPRGFVKHFRVISEGDPELGDGVVVRSTADADDAGLELWIPKLVEGNISYFRRGSRNPRQWQEMATIHLGPPPARAPAATLPAASGPATRPT